MENNIHTLKKKYGFSLLPSPLVNEVVNNAGYTEDDIKKISVLSSPVVYKKYFFYVAGFGTSVASRMGIKPSMLVCRRVCDGSLVYIKDCTSYSMDKSPFVFLGSKVVFCRNIVGIKSGKLYITNTSISNIGPELYCINPKTGHRIYAIAYYLPNQMIADYGVEYLVNQDADYSKYIGSNSRVCTHQPLVMPSKNKCKYDKSNVIYLGSSSLQNLANPGIIPGNPNYTTYPWYTDRGNLVRIEEVVGIPTVTSRVFTCAPELQVGDVLIKSTNGAANAKYDPFLPGATTMVIQTVTFSTVLSPGKTPEGKYYVQQTYVKGVNPTLLSFSDFWGTLGTNIILNGNKNTLYDIAGIIAAISASPSGTYRVEAYLNSNVDIKDMPVSGQQAVNYIKKLKVGDVVLNKYDANALGYWANSVWGDAPLLYKEKDIVFTTGQAHSIPLDENFFFMGPEYNYRQNKIPLIDMQTLYASNQTKQNFKLLDKAKTKFGNDMRSYSLTPMRSPRGQMSYSDALFHVDKKTLSVNFAFRSAPSDVYTFLGFLGYTSQQSNDIDGDCSVSAFASGKYIGFHTKSGVGITVDVGCINKKNKWNDTDPATVGVMVGLFVYTGPNGLIGGSNYSVTQSKYDDNIIGNSYNASNAFNDGSTGSSGQFETFITHDGVVVPSNKSVVYSYDIISQDFDWMTILFSSAIGSSTYHKGYYFTNDFNGTLYAINTLTGKISWVNPAGSDPQPLGSGIANAVFEGGLVFWLSSYQIPIATQATQYGWVLESSDSIELDGCYDFLDCSKFNSIKGSSDKPSVAKWNITKCKYKLKVDEHEYVVEFNDNGCFREVKSCNGIVGRFINKNLFKFTKDCVTVYYYGGNFA